MALRCTAFAICLLRQTSGAGANEVCQTTECQVQTMLLLQKHKSSLAKITLDDQHSHDVMEEIMLEDEGTMAAWDIVSHTPTLEFVATGAANTWSPEEVSNVIGKIEALVANWGSLKKQFVKRFECYVLPGTVADPSDTTREPCTHFPSWEGNAGRGFGRDPTWRLILRAGFHSCIPAADGSGGCDGSAHLGLFPGGVFTQWARTMPLWKENQKRPDEGKPGGAQQNGNLALFWDAMEELYKNKDFPPQSKPLNQSLFKTGKSRADLWALATLLAAHHGFVEHNKACDEGKTLWHVLPDILHRGPCKVELSKPLRFFSGRQDLPSEFRPNPWTCSASCKELQGKNLTTDPKCSGSPIPCTRDDVCKLEACKGCDYCLPAQDGTWRPRAYETHVLEAAPSNIFNGTEIADFFKKNFNFSKRETIALMGAHSQAQFHPPVSALHGYDWVHLQSGSLNNDYYRLISIMPSLAFEFGTDGKRGGKQKAYGVGGTNGEPVTSSWVGGGATWGHRYQRCPFCLNGKNVDRHRYFYGENPDRCCELCHKASWTSGRWPDDRMFHGQHSKAKTSWEDQFQIGGLNESEKDEFMNNVCMKPTDVHENAISADLALYWKFHYPPNASLADGTLGALDSGGNPLSRLEDGAELNDLSDPGDLAMHQIVTQYADNLNLWADEFVAALEKVLTTGVKHPLVESFAFENPSNSA